MPERRSAFFSLFVFYAELVSKFSTWGLWSDGGRQHGSPVLCESATLPNGASSGPQ